MALQKQQVALSFSGGVDTKTDDKQVLPTKLLELENGIFTKKGSIQKRNGYGILSRSVIASNSSISEATGISTFKDQLLLFTGTELYNYIEASQSWNLKGSASSVTNMNRSIIRNNFQQTDVDYAYNSGISVYAWKDSSGGSRYSVIDEQTGVVVQSNQLLSNTAQQPRVIGLGKYIFILYIEGTIIKLRTIQTASPHLISTAEDLTTVVDATDKIYDAHKIGDRIFVAYNRNNVGGSIGVFYIAANQVVSSEVFVPSEELVGGCSWTSDTDNDNVWLSWYNGTEVRYAIWTYNLDVDGFGDPTVLVSTLVETVADVRNIASVYSDEDEVTFLYEIDNADGNFIRKNTGDILGVVGTPEVFVRSVGLASKFFTYNGEHYVTTAFDSQLQATYFVYSISGDLVTKINQGVGGGYTVSSILPTAVQMDTGKFIVPTLKKGVLQAEDGVLFTLLGVSSTIIDFTALNNFITAELADNLHIVGGVLQSYDGVTVNETGFAIFPEGISSTIVDVGTGNMANGTYQYSVVYAWTDNQGKLHRSTDSIGFEVVIAGGPSNVDLEIPTLRISKKDNVFIEVYRTEANGTLFYKVTSNTALTLNDPTVDTIVYSDDKTDAQLISGEILYTTGGVLSNISPPSCTAVVNWKNRLIIKSSDEQNVIWYSKIRNEGFPVEFSDELTVTVDPRGGDITALGVLDDKLIIFKESSIHLLAGDGPNNLGLQSDFGQPQLLASDVGCVDINSVIETPVGLMFKSSKGIFLLDRGLSVIYVGAEVEAFNGSRITASRLVPDVNQIRFTTEDNLCLVFDYYFKQWSTFTNHEAVGATIYDGSFCFIKANGFVYKEDTSSFMDGSNRIKMKIVSAWMSMADLQGFQRFYKLLLLGSYKSKHRLRVKLGYNFNTAFTEETEIIVQDTIDPTAYGEDSPYGSGSPYGGEYPLYQWRIFPKQQKCQSFRVCIEDIMDDVYGESFSISNMRLEIGVKQGSNKLATNRSVGST